MDDDADADGQSQLEFLAMARERTAQVLQQRKRVKRRLMLAAERFNSDENFKKWVPYAQELQLLPTPHADANSIASFLRSTPGLDKTQIGQYISKGPADKYPLIAAVLKTYTSLFDFSRCVTFDAAMRQFLDAFRLPGEAQCIDRVMEAFSKEVFKQCPAFPFETEDAAFVLSFSVIMLNTDLHNPNMGGRAKMTLKQFLRNNEGIDGGKDLPKDFLEAVYRSIKDDEIELRESGNVGDEMAALEAGKLQWARLLEQRQSRSIASASFTPSRAARTHLFPAGIHERDMFSNMSGAAFGAMVGVLEATRDDILVVKAAQVSFEFSVIFADPPPFWE